MNNPTPHTVRIKYISKKLASIIFRYQHKARSKVLQNKNFRGQAKHYARYQHKARSKVLQNTYFSGQAKHYADAWADKFVSINLHPQLTSWLKKLDVLFPKELPFSWEQIRKMCFTTTGVTVDDTLKHHKDPDLLYSGIGWFIQGDCFPVAKLPFFSSIPNCIIVEKKSFTL